MRLTRRVFDDLAIWMTGFGLLVGAVFPLAVVAMGMPHEAAMAPGFVGMCLLAGATVGLANILIARAVVLPRVRGLADAMERVEAGVVSATLSGDWSRCDPERCTIPVDSDDAIGQAAAAHNGLVQALSHSHEVEERVDRFAEAMSSQLELAPLCVAAVQGFLTHVGADAVAILVLRAGTLEVVASHGISDPDRLVTDDRSQRAMATGKAQELELPGDIELCGGIVEFRPTEVCFLPATAHGQQVGLVVLGCARPRRPELRSLTRIFSRTFAVALSNAVTHTQLQHIAALDPLTGCYNRRFGRDRLHEELHRARRAEGLLAIVMFDIDHFKAVNDTYGHLVGDRVLVGVARAARQRLREGDVLVRYGGEEFLAILPGASAADAAGLCERIRRAVEDCAVRSGDQVVRCTVSLGHADLLSAGDVDADAVVALADAALYEAKRAGRNRVRRAA